MKHLNIHIFGRVQGVGFRALCKKMARNYQIAGYTQNMSDGSVYVEAEGDSQQLELFLKAIQQGNGLSHVSRIQSTEWPIQGFEEFIIKYG